MPRPHFAGFTFFCAPLLKHLYFLLLFLPGLAHAQLDRKSVV